MSVQIEAVRPASARRTPTHNLTRTSGIGLGVTMIWFSLLVLLPLAAVVATAAAGGWDGFWRAITNEQTAAAIRITVTAAFAVTLVNIVIGTMISWVLVRDRFPGKGLLELVIDIPFALPTIVAGLVLLSLYGNDSPLGLHFANTKWSIYLAFLFVTLPFIVRTVQPVLEELDREVEEAAATLGASRRQTVFKVLLPSLAPAVLTGFALAFARAVGEYGSVVFIAGNIPYVSEIAPLLIVIRLEEFNYAGATAIATIMLVISFSMLLLINLIQAWSRRRYGHV